MSGIPTDIKNDFPVLRQQVHGKPLIYLDSGNTSQKPRAVIDAMSDYYETINANVHRGSYEIAVRATDALEGARAKVARFINAPAVNEVVLTKNATEAMNLLARSWGAANLGPGDAVVISEMEHHANIVPWHMLAAEKGFELRWIPVTADGHLDLTTLDTLLDGAKLLSITAMSWGCTRASGSPYTNDITPPRSAGSDGPWMTIVSPKRSVRVRSAYAVSSIS